MNQIELKKTMYLMFLNHFRCKCLSVISEYVLMEMTTAMNQIELKKTIRYILENIENSRRVLSSVVDIKDKLIDLTFKQVISEREFYKISSLLSPQSRSPMWEKYFIGKHDCEKVSRNEERGDLKKDGRYYEYKSSGYNQDNSVHIVQIRPWQECDYIIQSISDDGAITFVLTHAEMMLEMEKLKAARAHGTKALVNNENIEYRMTLNIDSADWNRWG